MGEAEKQRQWTWWTEWHWKYSCVRVCCQGWDQARNSSCWRPSFPPLFLTCSLRKAYTTEQVFPLPPRFAHIPANRSSPHCYVWFTGRRPDGLADVEGGREMEAIIFFWKDQHVMLSTGGFAVVSWHLCASGLWKELVSKLWTASKVLWLLEARLKS